jgi:predicted dehydrogenase
LKKKFNVLIIGCGNIAGDLDLQSRNNNFLSHAGNFNNNKNFLLTSCIEPNKKRRLKFMRRWKIKFGFKNINDFLKSNLIIDVISICTPTNDHMKTLIDSFKIAPKLIFCEKPMTNLVQHTKKIIKINSFNKIPILINYSRRFDNSIVILKKKINSKTYGQLRSINAVYNKGLLNNGSHILDLLIFLIGKLKIEYVGTPIFDYKLDDPTVPFFLKNEQGIPVHINCGNANDYAFFEIQFNFSKFSITLENNGLKWRYRKAIKSKFFLNYKELTQGIFYKGNYLYSMKNAINLIKDFLNNKTKKLISTPKTSLESQIICESVKKMSLNINNE